MEAIMTGELKIRTNCQPRNVLRWWDLTDKERAEFDYIAENDATTEGAEFGRYRGVVYDLHDMERGFGGAAMPEQFEGWDNYQSDSYFSGILIRWVDNGDRVIFATYIC
jgi:hypothetical protein